MKPYLAWVWRQLGIDRKGTPGDSMSIIGHVDGMDSLLCRGVTHHSRVRFTGLRFHFARYSLLVGT